jgi:hypothetical protein
LNGLPATDGRERACRFALAPPLLALPPQAKTSITSIKTLFNLLHRLSRRAAQYSRFLPSSGLHFPSPRL